MRDPNCESRIIILDFDAALGYDIESESEREREKDRERETEKNRERERYCINRRGVFLMHGSVPVVV